MDTEQKVSWPRIRDLPAEQREPFEHWLRGQTCPWLEGVPETEQDAYHQGDYDRWHYGWQRHQQLTEAVKKSKS